LLDFQKKFPPNSRVDVTWDDPVMNFSGRIVGKGRLDTSGKAIFQVLYDVGGEKFWHEVDSTPVSLLAAKLKTLVVGGERVTELTEVPDLVTGDVTVACLITQLQKHRAELVVAFLTAMDGIDKHDADALREAVASEDCEAGAHNILFPLMDVGTGEIIQLISAVVSNGNEAVNRRHRSRSRPFFCPTEIQHGRPVGGANLQRRFLFFHFRPTKHNGGKIIVRPPRGKKVESPFSHFRPFSHNSSDTYYVLETRPLFFSSLYP
jgi:hypothetical protein